MNIQQHHNVTVWTTNAIFSDHQQDFLIFQINGNTTIIN